MLQLARVNDDMPVVVWPLVTDWVSLLLPVLVVLQVHVPTDHHSVPVLCCVGAVRPRYVAAALPLHT